MKAGILVVVVAVGAVALWMSGVLTTTARHLLISNVSAGPMGSGGIAAVLTIDNQGEPDRLLKVSSGAGDAQFLNANRGLPIRVGTSSLARDAAHVMILSVTEQPKDGTLIPLTLRFEKAGEVSVKARYAVPAPGTAAAHAAMGHGMTMEDVTDGPAPTLGLKIERGEAGWVAHIAAQNFTFSQELQDGDHVPGTGHGHIYLGDMKLGRVFSDRYQIGVLPSGKHLVRVTLNTNDHRAYAVDGQPISVQAIIEVD